ncbi:hypothetical protein [Streptomyces sp. NPDC050388]|uniref:hypothetical protein n=1 Tax=Streptomyces sp. NPDC050388 TaxID=3155781 RepID=UPI00343DBF59
MALKDASVLADALVAYDDAPAAPTASQDERLERTSAVVPALRRQEALGRAAKRGE